jgi:hypothetical protein
MKLSSVLAVGGAAATAVVALAFASATHAGLDSSPVASMTSPTPTASARSQVESPEAVESPEPADSPDPSESPDVGGPAGQGTHPCNHGFYVSQAAHLHKGGPYVSSIAKSDLGKNGVCTAPLPTPAP